MLERLANYCTNRIVEPSMIIQNLTTSLDVLIVVGINSGKKRSPQQYALHFAAILAALVVLNGLWEITLRRMGSYFFTHLVLLVGYAAALGQFRQRSCQITLLLFYAVEVCVIVFSSAFPAAMAELAYGSTAEIWLRNASVLLTVPIALWFYRYSIRPFHSIPDVSLWYAVTIALSTASLCWYYNEKKASINIPGHVLALLALACVLVLNLVAYYLDYSVCKHNEAERQLMAEKYMAQSERNLMELSRQNLEELRAIRHDIKNQYAYMNVLLQEQRYEELAEFFNQNKQANSKPLSGIDCGNLVLNTILNLEQSRAHAQGCTLDHRVFVAPQLPFAETDLCSLFTNLIDNALEAIQRQKIPHGVVEVGINQKNAALYICVLNPVDEQLGTEKLLSLRTTKKEKALHGYGSHIVDSIVQKYDGQITRSIENGKYRVDIMLNLHWAENTL